MKEKNYDYYKYLLKRLCEARDISLKPRFEYIEDLVIIHLKNNIKEGVDLDCLKILTIFHETMTPLNIKYNIQLTLYPNRKRLDRIAINLNKKDYFILNKKLEKGEIN